MWQVYISKLIKHFTGADYRKQKRENRNRHSYIY